MVFVVEYLLKEFQLRATSNPKIFKINFQKYISLDRYH